MTSLRGAPTSFLGLFEAREVSKGQGVHTLDWTSEEVGKSACEGQKEKETRRSKSDGNVLGERTKAQKGREKGDVRKNDRGTTKTGIGGK